MSALPPTLDLASCRSVAAVWRARIRASPTSLAFESLRDGVWTPTTWRQADDRVRRLAAGFVARGVAPGARVAILCNTRLEWVLVDFAILCAGAATSTIYPSSTPDEAAFVLEDAGCVAVVVEDRAQLQKLRTELGRLAHVALFVVVDPREVDDSSPWVSLEALEAEGALALEADPELVDRRIDAIGPEDLATLIYTSGTTGRPKGVMLVHANWLAQARALAGDLGRHLLPGDKQYLFLPLAHSFGKICELLSVVMGAPTAIEGRIDLLVDGLKATRPTLMCAVPRVFEKVWSRLQAGAKERGPRAERLLAWARDVGERRLAAREAGTSPGPWLALQGRIADALVFSKLRDGLGGRVRAFVSGGAPLSVEIARFFAAAGITILEGYGLTETAAAAVNNRLDDHAFGTVGRALEGSEFAIAADGEVLLRGPNVMRGYWNRPEATREALDADGWLHTGDLGERTPEGRLRITGRKKDVIVTSGGKNIAPLDTEGRIKARCPLLAELVMQGDRHPYCVALAWLDPDVVKQREERSGRGRSFAEVCADPATEVEVFAAIEEVNATLPSYAGIKRVLVLDHPLDAAPGLLTPSMKVKRNVVAERYADRVALLYGDR